jgi:beta-glucanase (GH16 family)
VTPGRFHTYTVDWTPAGFRFRYDGALCLTVPRWIPAPPLRAPQPFDQPFFVLLEFATGTGVNAPPPAMHLPVSMFVDYVRVWGP